MMWMASFNEQKLSTDIKSMNRTCWSSVKQYQFVMSKANAKKNNLPQIEQIKHRLANMQKFYLVGITGRTSFILENIYGTKFKITIGNELKCSCPGNNNHHCLHTLYVLTQIFYLPNDHALLFRHAYDDKELRYIIANRRIHENKVSDFLKYVKIKMPRRNVIIEEEDEQDDHLCAICHMQIVKCDATTSCATVCRNTFHLECFMQWAKHEIKNNGVVKCPLCRDEKPPEIMREIKQKEYEIKEQQIAKKVGSKDYNYYCDGCELREIDPNQTVYKCIYCEDVTLCDNCFKLGKHIKHSFICKYGAEKKWRECEDRKMKKKMDAEMGYIRVKLKNSRRLTNFLAATLPCFFSKSIRWNIVECKKLDIKVEELQCIACSDKQKAFLRKLSCGHFIHHRCLRKRIEKSQFYCKLDGQKYLLGYQNLLKHELLNKKTEQIQQKQDSEQQEEEKEDRKSPSKLANSSKMLRTEKSTTSCDSRKKRKKDKRSIQDRNLSVSSKFVNPQ